MSIFSINNGQSPVAQDFIWLSEFLDGTHLAEFDLQTKEENSFYSIKRDKLIRFGLIGHGMRLFFDVDGIFYLNGKAVELMYRTKDKEYNLTGHWGTKLDIITYKDAETNFNPSTGAKLGTPTITQYNFGYKAELKVEDITFKLKPVIKIPHQQPVFIHLWLVANKSMSGEIVIRVNNRESQVMQAPLKKGVGGELNWIVAL